MQGVAGAGDEPGAVRAPGDGVENTELRARSSGFGRRVGTDDADELVHQVRSGRKGVVNALR